MVMIIFSPQGRARALRVWTAGIWVGIFPHIHTLWLQPSFLCLIFLFFDTYLLKGPLRGDIRTFSPSIYHGPEFVFFLSFFFLPHIHFVCTVPRGKRPR